MTPDSKEILQLKKAGRHAWRLGWYLAAVQVVATAAGIGSYNFIPKRYESTTTIRVERQQMANPLAPQSRIGTDDIEGRVRSLREEILSPDYFDKVISRLGLEPPGATRLQHEALVLRMIENTTVVTRQRDTFQVTYGDDDPRRVRDITNVLAGIFIEESLEGKTGDAGAVVEFLQGQLEFYRKKLEDSEAALRRFEEEHVDQVPATRAAQLGRVEQMRANLIEVQNNLKQARLQRELLRQRVAGAPASGAGAAAAPAMQIPNPLVTQIREKESQLRRLLRDFSESYPDVVALRAEIRQMQQEVDEHPTVPADRAPAAAGQNVVQDALAYAQLERLELDVNALSAREEQLQREIERVEKRVQGIPQVEQELAQLRRDYDVNNDIYNSFLRRLEEARVSQELEITKKGEVFRILQAAAMPLRPVRPTKVQVLVLGAGGGLALNLALVALFFLRDTSFQSAKEVKAALGVKILAGIPRHRPRGEVVAARVKAVGLALLGALYLAGVGAFMLWQRLSALLAGGR